MFLAETQVDAREATFDVAVGGEAFWRTVCKGCSTATSAAPANMPQVALRTGPIVEDVHQANALPASMISVVLLIVLLQLGKRQDFQLPAANTTSATTTPFSERMATNC